MLFTPTPSSKYCLFPLINATSTIISHVPDLKRTNNQLSRWGRKPREEINYNHTTMRLNLVIQRHGLPVTRILWTTSQPSVFGGRGNVSSSSSYALPASSSVIASTRTPNAAFANGYTIAQLLEDVNGVLPLETEGELVDDEYSGAWGLEDYVVEVGGFECMHFMEVDGLLRDGDEVV